MDGCHIRGPKELAMSPASKSAKKSVAASKDSPTPATAISSRQRLADQLGVSEADSGPNLVEKSSGHIKHLEHGSTEERSAHRKGHGLNQEVKSLAHIYTPWANVRANGSGIVAIAAWSKRLAEEGKSHAKDATDKAVGFTRGLTHR